MLHNVEKKIKRTEQPDNQHHDAQMREQTAIALLSWITLIAHRGRHALAIKGQCNHTTNTSTPPWPLLHSLDASHTKPIGQNGISNTMSSERASLPPIVWSLKTKTRQQTTKPTARWRSTWTRSRLGKSTTGIYWPPYHEAHEQRLSMEISHTIVQI